MPKLVAPGARPVVAPPVRSNEGVRAWYAAQLRALIDEMNESAQYWLTAAFNKAPPTIGFGQDAPNPSVVIRKALKEWGDRWVSKFDDLSTTVAAKFADRNFKHTQRSMASAFKAAGFTVKFRPTARVKEAYQAVLAENIALIKSIPEQYAKSVGSAVWASVMRGGDQATLAAGLRKQYGITVRRAALIARDQNNKAKAIIENVRRQELGLTEAIWQHSSAGKVPRPTHVAMNGKRYKLAEGMYDSDEGKHVWPGQLINCRCTSRAVIPGFGD